MSQRIRAKGKTYVVTEDGDRLAIQTTMGRLTLPDGRQLQVRRAWLDAAADTADQELIPLNAAAAIRILALFVNSGDTATAVTLKQKAPAEASAQMAPIIQTAANGGAVLPFCEQGWAQTPDVNQAVVVTTGAGSVVGILALFVEIPSDAFDIL